MWMAWTAELANAHSPVTTLTIHDTSPTPQINTSYFLILRLASYRPKGLMLLWGRSLAKPVRLPDHIHFLAHRPHGHLIHWLNTIVQIAFFLASKSPQVCV